MLQGKFDQEKPEVCYWKNFNFEIALLNNNLAILKSELSVFFANNHEATADEIKISTTKNISPKRKTKNQQNGNSEWFGKLHWLLHQRQEQTYWGQTRPDNRSHTQKTHYHQKPYYFIWQKYSTKKCEWWFSGRFDGMDANGKIQLQHDNKRFEVH